MNIGEVVAELEKLQTEHGDLPIYVCADHGQIHYETWRISMCYVDSDGEGIAEEDLDEYDESDLTKAVIVDG